MGVYNNYYHYTDPGYLTGDIYDVSGSHAFHTDSHMSAVLGETDYKAVWPSSHAIFYGGSTINRANEYCVGCNGTFILDFTTTSLGDSDGVFSAGINISENYILESFTFPFPPDTEGRTAFVTFGDGTTQNFSLDLTVWGPETERLMDEVFWGITSTERITSIAIGLPDGGITHESAFAMNKLIIGSEISAVPVPASVWLFGSGLIGLIGFSRRKA